MHVVITGGSGLLGRALSRSLVADGHRVTVLSRRPDAARLPPGVGVRGWDAQTAFGWTGLIEEADALVNLAGENLAGSGILPQRWTPERKTLLRESRLGAGRAVIEALTAAARRPGVLVQASGVGYYGPRGDEPVAEGEPAGEDFLARLSVDWERSTAAAEALGLRRVVVRTGVVLSPHGGALPRLVLPFRLFAGGPLGTGRQWVPWIHVADEVAAIRFLIDTPAASGAYNLAAPAPVTNAELGRAIGQALGRPSLLPTPAFALRAVLGEVAEVVLTGQRAVPERLQALDFGFRFPALGPALGDLLGPGRGPEAA
jgi:hypothetical protein